MIDEEELKRCGKIEVFNTLKNMLFIFDVLLVGLFMRDSSLSFGEIMVIVAVLLIVAFIETRITTVGFFKNSKNCKIVFTEFTNILNLETITYRDFKTTKKKLDETLINFPTTKKAKLDYMISVYIKDLFEKLLIKVQNDEMPIARVNELAKGYAEYLDEEYTNHLKWSYDFFLVKKHKFQKKIEISNEIEKLERENFIYTQSNIVIQELAHVITKNGNVYYSDKRILFTTEENKKIFDIYIDEIKENTINGITKESYIITVLDKYIVNLDDSLRRIQMNEIIEYFKNK